MFNNPAAQQPSPQNVQNLHVSVKERRTSPLSSPSSPNGNPTPRITIDEFEHYSSPPTHSPPSYSPSAAISINMAKHILSNHHVPKSPKSPKSPSSSTSRGFTIGDKVEQRADWANSPARKKLKFTKTTSPSALTSLIQGETKRSPSPPPPQEAYVHIPQFYFPKRNSDNLLNIRKHVRLIFAENNDTVNYFSFGPVCTQLEIPEWFSQVLFLNDRSKTLSYTQFESFFTEYLLPHTPTVRIFHILRNPIFKDSVNRNYLVPSDFQPVLQALLEYHEGLSFLKETPAFQIKYSQTVILRIFFKCTGRIFRTKKSDQMIMYQREFTSRNIGQVLLDLPKCENFPNGEMSFFSYEHFYVIYCHFWELDTLHNFQVKLHQLGLTDYCNLRIKQELGDGSFVEPGEMDLDYADFVQLFLSINDPSDCIGSFELWWNLLTPEKTGYIHLPTIKAFWNSLQQQIRESQGIEERGEEDGDEVMDAQSQQSDEGGAGIVPWVVIERQIKDLWNITDLTNIPKSRVRAACTNRGLGYNVFLMLSSVSGWYEIERTGGGLRKCFTDWAATEYERLAAGDEEDANAEAYPTDELYDEELYDDVTMGEQGAEDDCEMRDEWTTE